MAVVSMHIGKLGPLAGRSKPRADEVEGLRWAQLFGQSSVSRRGSQIPRPGRAGLLAVWEDEAALDAYEGSHPFAGAIRDAYVLRLQPVRQYAIAEGIGELVTGRRTNDVEGPLVALTYGKLKGWGTLPRFATPGTAANRAVVNSAGNLATLGFARIHALEFLSFSIWRDLTSMRASVEGREGDTGHSDAQKVRMKNPFMKDGSDTYASFRPTRVAGTLAGRDPLAGLV